MDETQRRSQTQQNTIFELKERIAETQADNKIKQTQFDGKDATICTFNVIFSLIDELFNYSTFVFDKHKSMFTRPL